MPLLFPWLPNRHPDSQTEGCGRERERDRKRRWESEGWGGEGQKTKGKSQWAKQFCHREQIQLKSLLDGEELELSDQTTAMKSSERG